MYSSFLRSYNPDKAQKDVAENGFGDDDFDDISLFVSSRPSTDTRSPVYKKNDSSSPLHFCENPTFQIYGTGTGALQGMDDQGVDVSMMHTVPVFLLFLFQI